MPLCTLASEAKQYIEAINKVQQAYYVEYGKFSPDISSLGLGIKTETDTYKYQIKKLSKKSSISTAITKQKGLYSFTGAVFLEGDNTTNSIICISKEPRIITPKIILIGKKI